MSMRLYGVLGDLRTGRVFTRVSLIGCQWQAAPINGAGTISGATIDAADTSVRLSDLFHTSAPARAYLAIVAGDNIINAGPIWTRTYVRSTGVLTLSGSGLWSLFDHRFVVPLLSQPVADGTPQQIPGDTNYWPAMNLSLGDISAALVSQAQSHVGGNLPLVMPAAQGQTPGAERHYYTFNLSKVSAMLTELVGVVGGPEIQFLPSWTDSSHQSIQWTMLVGSPAQPLLVQQGVDLVFDASSPKTAVADIEYDDDATAMTTRMWSTGQGSQRGLLMAEADSTTLTAAGYPLLEDSKGYSTVNQQATLDAHARQDLARANRPSAVYKIKARIDGGASESLAGTPSGPVLGTYAVGSYADVQTAGDPFIPDGVRRVRIATIEGDMTEICTVTTAATTAEV